MKRRHTATIDLTFEEPIRSDILWKDVENMFIALGAEISQGRGSRTRIYLNGVRAVFHRPHPAKEIDKGALRSVRRFLEETEAREC